MDIRIDIELEDFLEAFANQKRLSKTPLEVQNEARLLIDAGCHHCSTWEDFAQIVFEIAGQAGRQNLIAALEAAKEPK